MTWEDSYRFAAAVLTSVGGGTAIVFGFSSWLGKVWATRILGKEQHELEKLRREHEVIFSKLHKKRAEVIAELYSYLIDCIKSVDLLYPNWAPSRMLFNQNELLKTAYDMSHTLILYFDKNRIYFSEELVALIEHFAKDLREHAIRYELYNLDEEGKAKLDNAMKIMKEQIPQAMNVIEDEFRILLGVKKQS